MTTYEEIQDHIKQHHQIIVKKCSIADVKRHFGLTIRVAPNRIDPNKVTNPCPVEKWQLIEDALKYFGDLK